MNEITQTSSSIKSYYPFNDLPDEIILNVFQWLPPVSLHHVGLSCRKLFALSNDPIFFPRCTEVPSNSSEASIVYANAYLIIYRENNALSNLKVVNRETGVAFAIENVLPLEYSSQYTFGIGYDYDKKHLLHVIDNETGEQVNVDLVETLTIGTIELQEVPPRKQYFQRHFFSKTSLCSIRGCISLDKQSFITFSKGGFIAYWEISDGTINLTNQISLFNYLKEDSGKNFKEVESVMRIGNFAIIFCANFPQMQLNLSTGELKNVEFEGLQSSSKANSHSLYTVDNGILKCYKISNLSLSWQASVESKNCLYLLNDDWVFCGTSSINPYEFIIFNARTGKLITNQPIRNLTNLNKNQVLCKNYFITWSNNPNANLKVQHIPTQTYDNFDFLPYIPSGQSYHLCDAKYFNNRFYICIQIAGNFRFIEFRPNPTSERFINHKQKRTQSNFFYKMPWLKFFQHLHPKDVDSFSLACRDIIKDAPKIISISLKQKFKKFDFANYNAIGFQTSSGELIITNRETGIFETIPKAKSLYQSATHSFYQAGSVLLIIHHASHRHNQIDFDKKAIKCIPLNDSRMAVISEKGITFYQMDQQFNAVVDKHLKKKKISTVVKLGSYAVILGEGYAQTLNLDTETLKTAEVQLPVGKTAVNSSSLFLISENFSLNQYNLVNGNLNFVSEFDRFYSPYTIEEVNESWLACYKRTQSHSNVYIYNILTGKLHLELLVSFQKSENLSSDYFISWNQNIVTLVHLPTRRQQAIDVKPYFPERKICSIRGAQFQKNRLLVAVSSENHQLNLLELYISNDQITNLFLKGIFSEAELLEP